MLYFTILAPLLKPGTFFYCMVTEAKSLHVATDTPMTTVQAEPRLLNLHC